MYLMDSNGVRETSKKTLVFIVGLHEEVEVFPRLEKEQKDEAFGVEVKRGNNT